VWLIILSDQLPIIALVSHYLTNKLIGRRPLPRRLAAFSLRRYAVLAPVSQRYPPPRTRSYALLTRPPLPPKEPCDLHVLSIPPAFALSQDQTLRFISCGSRPCGPGRRSAGRRRAPAAARRRRPGAPSRPRRAAPRVRPAAHRLGELAALLVADVAGRRADQPGDRVLLPYSLMSMRTIARSSSNRNSASALASSVLPTPVGPRNRNEPVGRSGSEMPARRGGRRRRRRAPPPPGRRRAVPSSSSMRSSFRSRPRASGRRGCRSRRDDLGDVVGADLLLDHERRAPGRPARLAPRLRRAPSSAGISPYAARRGRLEVALALGRSARRAARRAAP
jgi:hypothetical protein